MLHTHLAGRSVSKKESSTGQFQKADVKFTMYQTLHQVRLVLLGVVLAGAVETVAAQEYQSRGEVQSAGVQPAGVASLHQSTFPVHNKTVVPAVPFPADAPVTNSYARALPVPETPDIFLGMAGIGVMLILRRLFRR